MVLVWSFYAVNQCVDLETKTGSLESLLRSTVAIDNKMVKSLDDSAHIQYLKKHIKIESEEASSKIILLEAEGLEISTLLSFAGDSTVQELVLEWLKSEFGAIVFPIQLDQKVLVQLVDSILHTNKMKNAEFYRIKFLFGVETKQGSLKRIEMELDKGTMKTFSENSEKHVLENVIIPYIYQETGMQIQKLNLNMISMIGFAKFARDNITTVSNNVEDEVLLMLLKSAQLG